MPDASLTPTLVPVVDLTGWPDPDARDAIAAAVDDACRRVGFLQVTGHGVPAPVLDRALAALEAFFDLPAEVKGRFVPPSASVDRGYAARGSESLSYSLGIDAPPDLFEAFNVGPDDVDRNDPLIAPQRDLAFAPNVWPTEVSGFRDAIVAYFAEARALAHRLTDVFAVALDLDPGFFAPFTDHSTDMLRLLCYRREDGAPPEADGQMRMGAHTDYGICTVLYADRVEGLEIVGPDGAWHSVVPEPGALLVNLGDLLAEWTNDRWRSTIHRVVPPRTPGPAARRSMAFFHDGNYDGLIEVLPTCCSPDDPPRYPPVRAGDHLLAKLVGPRTLTRSDAFSTVGDRLGQE